MLKNPFPKNPFTLQNLIRRILETINPNNSVIEYTICNAVSKKVPYRQILSTIASQGKDNEKYITQLLGEELWQEVKNFQ